MSKNTKEVEVRLRICIEDVAKYNRKVNREYATHAKCFPGSPYSLVIALETALTNYSDLWYIEHIDDYKVCNRSKLRVFSKATPYDISAGFAMLEAVA